MVVHILEHCSDIKRNLPNTERFRASLGYTLFIESRLGCVGKVKGGGDVSGRMSKMGGRKINCRTVCNIFVNLCIKIKPFFWPFY